MAPGRWLRSLFRLFLVLGTAGEYCARFCLRRLRGPLSLAERAQWLHQSCAAGLRRLRIAVETAGAFPARGLLVSNHLSYLDILVYSSVAPCVFVSKKEVRRWPVFGPMAVMAGTVFIDRSRSADARRVNSEMQEALAAGVVVVLFPEGTSSDGATVLPFRPALFEGALGAGAPVTPAHLRYEVSDGDPQTDVAFWGTAAFLPHLLRLLSKREIRPKIRFAPAVQFDDRKIAAQRTREMVMELGRCAPGSADEVCKEAFGSVK
ncbi:MAG TPA: lysophospholipid acyltransferase family protein [Terriglobia bacterium]|nr:lysophospholipid acyltransferase family protein [Terriglobia bacterium]